jgi:hypothetical protein
MTQSALKIEYAIKAKQATIDDLAKRISTIRLGTPPRAKQSSSAPERTLSSAPFDIPPDVRSAVAASLDRHDRHTSIRIAKLTKPTISRTHLNHGSIASGPIHMDDLPPPGRLPSHIRARDPIKVEPSPAPSVATTTSPGFGGMKFSLDPGDIAISHSRSRTAGGGGRSHTHTSAAKLSGSPGASPTSGEGGGGFFALPQTPVAGGKQNAPQGFFSLSSFAK